MTPRMKVVLLVAAVALGGGCATERGVPRGSGGHGEAGSGGNGAVSGAGPSGAGLSGASNASGASGTAGISAGGAGATAGAGESGASPSGGAGATTGVGVGAQSGTGGAGGQTPSGGSPATGGSDAGNAGAPDGPDAGSMPHIELVAGTGTGDDGSPALSARVLNPYGAVVDPITGDVYIAEVDTGKIRHIDASGVITTVVGPGAPGGAADIVLNQPHDLLFQPGTRVLFIADTMNGNVYRLDTASGEVAQLVGPDAPFPGETRVYCLGFSPSGGELYFTTPSDIRVLELSTETEKPAVPYADARVIALDSKGTLYAVKNRPNGDALEVVDASGGRTPMAATVNVVSDPKHLALDSHDNVLIADTELHLLRRYDVATDTLSTLVGNGTSGTGMLGGDPTKAQLKRPHGVFEDKKTGVIYVSDSENDRVLKIVP